jgi:GMP synthase (glutamine-hydrolysing)
MIAILDFGGQYAHLIATRLRSHGVFTEIFDSDIAASVLQEQNVQGIVLSGGPQSVFDTNSPKIDEAIYSVGVPILSICYGHQLTCQTLGGKVVPGTKPEYGPANIEVVKKESRLMNGVSSTSRVWMSHNDEVEEIPEGFEIIASTASCKVAAVENELKQFYGVQFHPEVVHSKEGNIMLGNFVDICNQRDTWELGDWIAEECEKIQKQVGDKKVFLFVSGGVDSTVAFALLEKALGKEKVFGVFVDNGLLRLNERSYVEESIKNAGFENLHTEDAVALFLKNLEGKSEPEEKRKIIGDTFIEVQKKVTKDLNLNPEDWLLGQGTIYPDTIESGATKNSETIKTHHNRVPEIQKMLEEGKIIEPLADLYKDEVREVGRKLGLPDEMVDRHPFPGPGLGVRLLCNEESNIVTSSHIESKKGFSLSLLPIKSVGVQGDGRTYRHPGVVFLNNEKLNWEKLEAHKEGGRMYEQLANMMLVEQVFKMFLGELPKFYQA